MQILKPQFLKIFVLVLFMANSQPTHAISFTDWEAQTPGGHLISDNWGPLSIRVNDSSVVEYLSEWYFYKGHIIGSFYTKNDRENKLYFVFSEKSKQMQSFTLKEVWLQHLQENELNPKLYTRWYNSNWTSFGLVEFISLIVAFLVLWLLTKTTHSSNKLSKSQSRGVVLFGVVLVFVILKIKMAFPGSL